MNPKNRFHYKNNRRQLLQLLLVGSFSVCNFSCYYDQEVEFPEEAVTIPDDREITFQTDIEPLFSQSGKDCTVCHNGSVANPDLREGNAYDAIIVSVIPGDAENSTFFRALPGNDHPVGAGFSLSVEEIALIRGWIDRGAENN